MYSPLGSYLLDWQPSSHPLLPRKHWLYRPRGSRHYYPCPVLRSGYLEYYRAQLYLRHQQGTLSMLKALLSNSS